MTTEQETVLLIKGMISELPPAHREQCESMADHLRRMIADAGDVVGPLAIALVGAELDAEGLEKELLRVEKEQDARKG